MLTKTQLQTALVQAALRMVTVYDMLDLKEGQQGRAKDAEVLDLEEKRRKIRQEAS